LTQVKVQALEENATMVVNEQAETIAFWLGDGALLQTL
jgi:hypothetical protein